MDPVCGADPLDPVLKPLFEDLMLLFYRELLFGLDSLNLIAPAPPVLITNGVFSADCFNADFFAFSEDRQYFFLIETRQSAPPGQLSETQLMSPVVVSLPTDVVSGTGPVDTVPSALFQNLELVLYREVLPRPGPMGFIAPGLVAHPVLSA